MNKKTKLAIIILIVIIICTIIIMIGMIKGGFNFKSVPGSIDSMTTQCLKSTLTDNGNVSVGRAVPVTDEEGMTTEPYKYEIENNCQRDIEYFVVLNAMEGTNLSNLSKIKIAVTGDTTIGPLIENSLQEVQNIEGNNKDTLKSYKLDEGTLGVGQKKSFELRTWIDHDVTSIEGSVVNNISIKQFEK